MIRYIKKMIRKHKAKKEYQRTLKERQQLLSKYERYRSQLIFNDDDIIAYIMDTMDEEKLKKQYRKVTRLKVAKK